MKKFILIFINRNKYQFLLSNFKAYFFSEFYLCNRLNLIFLVDYLIKTIGTIIIRINNIVPIIIISLFSITEFSKITHF